MKTSSTHFSRSRRSQSGAAVLVMLAFLVLMTMLCAATAHAVFSARREVALIEKRQVARLAAATNAPAAPPKSMSAP
jgi:Tfp pilus assembly protein PilX